MTVKWPILSLKVGLSCVKGEMGCGGAELWRGLREVRLVGEECGWSGTRVGINGAGNRLAGDRACSQGRTLDESAFWALQGQVRAPLSCPAKAGARMSRIGGYSSLVRCSQNSQWRPFSHTSKENPQVSPAIISAGQKDGTAEKVGPPTSLFMTFQLKRLSNFREGITSAPWRKFLEVKKDVGDREKGPRTVEESNPAGQQMGGDRIEGDLVDSSELTVICFDIETTGFSISNDRIIEFAARDLAGGVCSTIETLVNPGKEVKNEHIHNISSHMVNNPAVPRWKDVGLAILDFVESRRKGQGVVILVAHNGKRFDVPFIMTEFHASGLSIPSYWRFADSMTLARLAMKGSGKSPLPGTALGKLFTYYNLPSVGEAHRAMADVNMLAQVLQMLMNDLEMDTSELLAQSFGAGDILPKSKDSSTKASVNGMEVVHMAAVDKKRVVDRANIDSGSASSSPWDRV